MKAICQPRSAKTSGWAWVIGGALSLPMLAAAQASLAPLTTARQVHQLSSQEAERHFPVHVRGVVTFYDAEIPELFVQDDTEGVFIEIAKLKLEPGFKVAVGQEIDVEGVTAAGGFSPDVLPERIHLVREKVPLPAPQAVTFEQLAVGQKDSQWVQFQGIVRSTGIEGFTHLPSLEVAGGNGRVVVPVQHFNPARGQQLIDAEVKVTGLCATHFNRRGQLMRVAIQLADMGGIEVLREAPLPEAIPLRKINTLLKYAPAKEFGHRVKVQGVVTLQQPGQSLFIRDDTQGLYIQTADTDPVQPGDRVEVLGFPLPCEYVSPVLQDAEFRKIGTGPPPQPLPIPAGEGYRDRYDATLVQMEAMLLSRVVREHEQVLELQASNLIFHAELHRPATRGDPLAAVPNHSRVQLTGVCLVPADRYRLDKLPQSFSLLLRSPADVVVLERPSWWTAEHTLWVLAGTLVVAGACLGWIAMLRRQVRAQTRIISQKVQREAALEERARIARDLHDDLGAGLTHIAFLSQVAQKEGGPPEVKEHLREIAGSAQDSFQALDEIVWVVNPKNDTLDQLASYICHFAEAFFRGTQTRCRLDLPPSLPECSIPTEIRNDIFLAVKEALNNVHKHARAAEVLLAVGAQDSALHIRIEDNGRGFSPGDASVRNGLANMRKRLERIGGAFTLESRPGGGTRIRMSVPLEAAAAVPAN
ncbi:MAG TPA: histidine kinase [Candidatus Acidoferrum sp.]|nr:histidine kinase [Candidatus Acidoferrum sp.]